MEDFKTQLSSQPSPLHKTEECFQSLKKIKDNFQALIFQLAHGWDTHEISGFLLHILEGVSSVRADCEDIDIPDFLNYLKKYVNNSGKICIEKIESLIAIGEEIQRKKT